MVKYVEASSVLDPRRWPRSRYCPLDFARLLGETDQRVRPFASSVVSIVGVPTKSWVSLQRRIPRGFKISFHFFATTIGLREVLLS